MMSKSKDQSKSNSVSIEILKKRRDELIKRNSLISQEAQQLQQKIQNFKIEGTGNLAVINELNKLIENK